MITTQKTFINGLDLIKADTQIDDASYYWLINARNRFGPIEPIHKSINLTSNAPTGVLQELIAVGNVMLLFAFGKAYYKHDDSDNWIQIPEFQMSPTAQQYWTCAVPFSTFSFVRKATANIHAPINVTDDFKLSGSPACVVVQDGINQPWIVMYDSINQTFTARVTKTFAEWQNNSTTDLVEREYVPIGKQMMFLNGILFIVAPDYKSVYRSITGRPLDFMINVDTNGHKMSSEVLGGAATVSFALDYDEVTCIQPINNPDSFVISSSKNTRIITMDYVNTIFGEPRFRVSALINAGIVNQNCFTEKLGDYVFISKEGVKSFNAVYNYKFKGSNSIFSLQISKLLGYTAVDKIYQQRPICISFDNYILFNIDTKYGNLIAVYDELLDKWIAFDVTEVSEIKKFAIVETTTENKLYCITWNNEVFQMYGSSDTETAFLRTKSWTAATADGHTTSVDHKAAFLRCMFNAGSEEGELTCIEYVDEQESLQNRTTVTLAANVGGVFYPVRPPVIPSSVSRVNNPHFALTQGLTGNKISFILSWNNDAKLIEYELETSETVDSTSKEQRETSLNNTYGTNS